jgi:hypothetical protein
VIPADVDIASSILFLGSGFSCDATNILGTTVPSGIELKNILADTLDVRDLAPYDLKTLADEFAARADPGLYQLLYNLFTIQSVADYQRDLLQMPWLRIYTTNYDDVVEFSRHAAGMVTESFNYDQPKPRRLAHGSTVHLHGTIRSTTVDNVHEQLVLTENSYVRQHFETSPWYEEFVRDVKLCDACFFLGYSLSDYHIKALLSRTHAKNKTYFIKRSEDRIFSNRVREYGSIILASNEDFALECVRHATPALNDDPTHLRGFTFLDPFKDRKTTSSATQIEVQNLVTYGTFNFSRFIATLPSSTYVALRPAAVKEALTKLTTASCLLVHSRLGNGKTIFLYILASALAELGYKCFLYNSGNTILQRELDVIRRLDKCAILFDSYDTAIDAIQLLSDLPSRVKFIIAVRTGVMEVRMHEIDERLPTPLERLNINNLRAEDREDFKNLLDRAGLRVKGFDQVLARFRDFREAVLSLYKHATIAEKLKTELLPLLASAGFKRVFVASQLLKWMSLDVDTTFLSNAMGTDAYAEMVKYREKTGDVFQLDDENLRVRSAILSEYLLQHFIDPVDISESIYKLLIAASRRKTERRYRSVLVSLTNVAHLKEALVGVPDADIVIFKLFERLRNDSVINSEPLFWLQYAILMHGRDDFVSAERFLDTAYARARATPNFRTFQLDTFALYLLLVIEERNADGSKIERFDAITKKLKLVAEMVGIPSNRDYAIRVLGHLEPFVESRIGAMTESQKMILVQVFNGLADGLLRVPDSADTTPVIEVRQSILRSKEKLVRGNKS